MSKATEQNDKLKRAIIISAVLHVILFAVLIWSSFDEHIEASAGGGGGSSIDAVMVDPGAIVQQYDRVLFKFMFTHKQVNSYSLLAQ